VITVESLSSIPSAPAAFAPSFIAVNVFVPSETTSPPLIVILPAAPPPTVAAEPSAFVHWLVLYVYVVPLTVTVLPSTFCASTIFCASAAVAPIV